MTMTKSLLPACLFGVASVLQAPCFAVKPVAGGYGGVFFGPTYSPNISFTFNPSAIPPSTINSFKTSVANYLNITVDQVNLLLPNTNVPGTLTHGILGGIGGEIGYRLCDKYRFEFELLYNNNPFGDLNIGQYTIGSISSNSILNIQGSTQLVGGMFNFIYDFLIPSRDRYSDLAPYLGFGLGYAYVMNDLTFNYGQSTAAEGEEPTTLYSYTYYQNRSALGAQAILGLSYWMDDFCWLSLDARYFTTNTVSGKVSNTGISYSNNTQLFSIMLGFHGKMSK